MVNIMNYKIYIYVITVLLSTYILSGVNFNSILKKNKVLEARLLVIILSIIMGYLVTNFIVDFINVSKII